MEGGGGVAVEVDAFPTAEDKARFADLVQLEKGAEEKAKEAEKAKEGEREEAEDTNSYVV